MKIVGWKNWLENSLLSPHLYKNFALCKTYCCHPLNFNFPISYQALPVWGKIGLRFHSQGQGFEETKVTEKTWKVLASHQPGRGSSREWGHWGIYEPRAKLAFGQYPSFLQAVTSHRESYPNESQAKTRTGNTGLNAWYLYWEDRNVQCDDNYDGFITRNELMGKTHRYTDVKGWGKVRGSALGIIKWS